MSLDLNKLENKLDEALSKETTETLTKFLTYKRMSNNKKQMKFYKNKFTNALISENDYKYISDTQKSQMILIQGGNK